MSEPLLSRFTPSLMSPETLEAIFVQREALAQRLVELIRESAQDESKQHTLIVGPRGIGKTHLVALIYHRLRSQESLKEKLVIAWLREEEWGISSFLDLLLRILATLRAEYGTFGLEELESFFDLLPDEAERSAGDLLVRYVGSKSLLVIAENLDEIFSGLGSTGQRRFRAFLQERGIISILATSQSLFNGVSLQTSPFYGFFRVHHLAELDHREAVQLLTRIAELTGKPDLVSALGTPEGRARVRAVHHLAGGNPRIFIIFSQFLTRSSLDELVGPMIALLDDLTPYYQARMAWLSPQQRKIVEFLCDRQGAVTVKEIAKQCFASQQSASSQLKTLRGTGYVRSLPVGRESYYEIREPLLRLCLDLKRYRGEPVRLLVDFLRLWYSRKELTAKLSKAPINSGSLHEALLRATKLSEYVTVDPRVSACFVDFMRAAEEMNSDQLGDISDEILALIGFDHGDRLTGDRFDAKAVELALLGKAIFCIGNSDWAGVIVNCKFAIGVSNSNELAWCLLGLAHIALGEAQEAEAASEEALAAGFSAAVGIWAISSSLARLGQADELAHASFKEELALFSSRASHLVAGFFVGGREEIAQTIDIFIWGAVSLQFHYGKPDWKKTALEWVRRFRESAYLASLGVALARSALLFRLGENRDAMKLWLAAWREASSGIAELGVPLRLMEGVVRFLETNDGRVLLELSSEERRVVEALLAEPAGEFSNHAAA